MLKGLKKWFVFCFVLVLACVCGIGAVSAADEALVWDFSEGIETDGSGAQVWEGCHPSVAALRFDETEGAAKINVYSISYLGGSNFSTRFWNNQLKVPVSETQNRYVKIKLKVDSDVNAYHFTKTQLKLQCAGDAAASAQIGTWFETLNGQDDYVEVIIDMGFTEEKELNMLRLDIIAEESGDGNTGAAGWMYIKYIGLFDTLEEAEAYGKETPVPPTTQPADTTPVPTEPNQETGDSTLTLAAICIALAMGGTCLYIHRKRSRA